MQAFLHSCGKSGLQLCILALQAEAQSVNEIEDLSEGPVATRRRSGALPVAKRRSGLSEHGSLCGHPEISAAWGSGKAAHYC